METVKKFGAMSHEAMGAVLSRVAAWGAGQEASQMVVRLVCEVYRLRQRNRLQRRTIERLEELLHDATHPAPERTITIADLPGADVLRAQRASPLAASLTLASLLTESALRMALAMQERLDANAHKGGWEDDGAEVLHQRLVEEASELLEAILAPHPEAAKIRREAADVANFAMMIADVAGDLDRFDAEAEIGTALAGARGNA